MQGRPAFRAHRRANQKDNKLARLGHQRDDDHTRAPIHLTGQDRGWQQDSQREREREREREKKAAAGRADWGQRADAEQRLDFFASFSPTHPPLRIRPTTAGGPRGSGSKTH